MRRIVYQITLTTKESRNKNLIIVVCVKANLHSLSDNTHADIVGNVSVIDVEQIKRDFANLIKRFTEFVMNATLCSQIRTS
jgi:hypothetical protein